MKNRSDIEIIASILRSAVTNWEYQTTIMNNASVSHSQITRYLAMAVSSGLVEYSNVTGLYKTTENGLKFLDKHENLLKLFPSISELPDLNKVRIEDQLKTK